MLPSDGTIVRPDPLAFFFTWTTHASWLPGDRRGWFDRHGEYHAPHAGLSRSAALRLKSGTVILAREQRCVVEEAIVEHCRFRGWIHLASSCRSNHVHAVVAAPNRDPREVLRSLKSRASRCLSQDHGSTRRWWTKGGSRRCVFSVTDLSDVLTYVLECQDKPRS